MAGADLKTYIPQITELAEKISSGEVTEIDGCKLRDGTDAVLRNAKLYKPIIAAVDGPCVAGGMEMLGGIDIRIATPQCPLRRHGTEARSVRRRWHDRPAAEADPVPCGDGVPPDRGALPAERALELGLINEIVEPDELMDRAFWWAGRILANGPLAIRATKESVLRGLNVTTEEAYKIEQELSQTVFASEDAKEGPKAFAEKRKANWKNR